MHECLLHNTSCMVRMFHYFSLEKRSLVQESICITDAWPHDWHFPWKTHIGFLLSPCFHYSKQRTRLRFKLSVSPEPAHWRTKLGLDQMFGPHSGSFQPSCHCVLGMSRCHGDHLKRLDWRGDRNCCCFLQIVLRLSLTTPLFSITDADGQGLTLPVIQ